MPHAYELPMSGRARTPSTSGSHAGPLPTAPTAPPASAAPPAPAGSSSTLPAAQRPRTHTGSDSNLRISTAIRTKSPSGRHIPQGPESVRLLIKGGLQKIDGGADHFALLGVTPGASHDQIRHAYFELARQLHPDRIRALHIDDLAREAQRLFAQINTAFAILSNPKRHAEYVAILNAGGEKVMRKQQEEAEQVALRLLQAEDHFRRGEMALRRHQFADAVVDFRKSVELNPAEGEHHAALAWATWCSAPDKAKVQVEVRKGLEKGIELSPNSPAPYLYKGRIAKSEGRDDAALQNFEKVLDLAPGNVDAEAEVRLLQSRRAKQDPAKGGGGLFGRFKR
jgi:DnaJ-domain-containing protein 1